MATANVYLTYDDMQERFQCSYNTLRARISEGVIPKPQEFGRLKRWHRETFEQWEREQAQNGN